MTLRVLLADDQVLIRSGFAALIILHELGHFTAAKAVGMRVERFSLFFGRTKLRWQRGETEYGVGWLSLRGFVEITGGPSSDEYLFRHEFVPAADRAGDIRLVDSAFVAALRAGWTVMIDEPNTIRDVAREKGVDDETLDKALDLQAMAHPHDA